MSYAISVHYLKLAIFGILNYSDWFLKKATKVYEVMYFDM